LRLQLFASCAHGHIRVERYAGEDAAHVSLLLFTGQRCCRSASEKSAATPSSLAHRSQLKSCRCLLRECTFSIDEPLFLGPLFAPLLLVCVPSAPEVGFALTDIFSPRIGSPQGMATAVTVASTDRKLAKDMMALFTSDSFRALYTPDVVGVEVGGAVKNVIAIAAGMSEGLGLGTNAMAALVTRGCGEMRRLVCTLDGESATVCHPADEASSRLHATARD